jgi:hypothetical protein
VIPYTVFTDLIYVDVDLDVNSFPDYIRHSDSLISFKANVKTYLFGQFYD